MGDPGDPNAVYDDLHTMVDPVTGEPVVPPAEGANVNESDASCGCEVKGTESRSQLGWLMLAGLVPFARRRRGKR